MEFKALENIETSFRQIRLFSLIFLVCCTLVTGYALWKSYRFAEAQRRKVYVLDEGRSLMVALSQDASLYRPAEGREHIRRFHELFFSLSPDKSAIENNITRALVMADRNAMAYYQDMLEKGYFNRLIAAGIIQTVVVDSVLCDFDRYPYPVKTYARQRIIRESTITERSLVTTGQLINVSRSDANPQGFMLEKFTIIENKDLATYER